MPPLRRARGAAASSGPYIRRGWLSRCRRARRVPDGDGDERPLEHESTTSILKDDALAAVFARLRDGPAVVRCASTCRRWGRVVCNEAASLSCTLPLLGALALGFFHQDVDAGRRRAAKEGPIFVPATSATRLLGFHGPSAGSLLDGVGLECSRAVASRNGRLVLELRRERRADGLRLCICNPMTSDAVLLPPLCGEDMPGYYACAFLTGHDVDPPVFSPTYYRLLLVYNRRGFTALRRYSSDTASWEPEVKADVRISNGWLRNMVQAAALRGVVYWRLNWHVLGVRLDGATMEQYMLPYGCPRPTPVTKSGNGTIGVSPEGRLCLVTMIMPGHIRSANTELHE
jgi:hypothetical protein